jgi:cobalt/nickel transport protein
MKPILAAAALAALALATPAAAHFQLIYNPEANPAAPGELPLKLIFWHPFENGRAMDMAAPEEFFYVFKGEKIDLAPSLRPIVFRGADNEAAAFEGALPVRRNGDYIVALVPAPYYEASEDIYIQQIAKAFLNKGGIPTGWSDPVGLKAEFVPLNKPTNVLAGSSFSAQLLSDGRPVPGAEVEIAYLAAAPDMEANAAGPVTAAPPPGGALVAITDPNGVFTFAIPKAGFWGFAALGVGPDAAHAGKELSQDAVIWIRAYEME